LTNTNGNTDKKIISVYYNDLYRQSFSSVSVITQFWVIPQNSFFSQKNKKNKKIKNKIKAGNAEKADQERLQNR
jgi:hypothetical protein